MNENTKITTAQVNPIVAKAAAGVRKRRKSADPVPAKLYAPTAGQLDLFDTLSEDQP